MIGEIIAGIACLNVGFLVGCAWRSIPHDKVENN